MCSLSHNLSSLPLEKYCTLLGIATSNNYIVKFCDYIVAVLCSRLAMCVSILIWTQYISIWKIFDWVMSAV